MAYEYRDVTPVYENTTMKGSYNTETNELSSYRIYPVSGYVLHDKACDIEDMDINGNITYKLGYTAGSVTCAADYDFEANPREFYAVPENSVPADQIFGGGNNDHEVM